MKKDSLKSKVICLLCCLTCTAQMACKKLIEVDEPINTLTSTEIFSTDATATSAMAGVYSAMINGTTSGTVGGAFSEFSAGLSTNLGGLSSDEFYTSNISGYNSMAAYSANHLTAANAGASTNLWTSAYDIIYKSNSVIQGIAASTSPSLHDNIRKELTAEAKFVRAFCYFYLTNFFGDVPMALTVDFNKTENLPRMPQQQVYLQIIADLKDAQAGLPADFSAGNGERIIPNKWAATLLLARAYLYTGDYSGAFTQSSALISNNSLFGLEPDLNNVFSTTSREAVWQLKQTSSDPVLKNATPEGYTTSYILSAQLLSAFEPGDQRRVKWVDSAGLAYVSNPVANTYYPHKYIIGQINADASQPPPQYYTVLRLAEAYLIRSEAEANGATGGAASAIADLNMIRARAGLANLNSNLIQQPLKDAVARERQVELFAEWGHRWFDLKRTGQAHSVLSAIPAKQPWAGDYQLLYPVPLTEMRFDHNLTQNIGY